MRAVQLLLHLIQPSETHFIPHCYIMLTVSDFSLYYHQRKCQRNLEDLQGTADNDLDLLCSF